MNIRVDGQLLLRTYQPFDAEELFRCVDRNRAHLRAFLPWVNATLKPADSMQFIRHCLVQETAQQGLAMGIFLNDTLVGSIGMHRWDHQLRKAQIGYWIGKEQEGKGIMLRSVRAFIQFLFSHLKLNKVEIHFLPFNTRSATLSQRLGAKIEGILRDSIQLNGAFEDIVVAGILQKEWEMQPA